MVSMARENTSMARKAKGRDVEDRGQLSRYNRVQMDSSKLLTLLFDTFSIVSTENRRTSHSLGERVCCYQIRHHRPPSVGQPAFFLCSSLECTICIVSRMSPMTQADRPPLRLHGF